MTDYKHVVYSEGYMMDVDGNEITSGPLYDEFKDKGRCLRQSMRETKQITIRNVGTSHARPEYKPKPVLIRTKLSLAINSEYKRGHDSLMDKFYDTHNKIALDVWNGYGERIQL